MSQEIDLVPLRLVVQVKMVSVSFWRGGVVHNELGSDNGAQLATANGFENGSKKKSSEINVYMN